MKSKTLTKSNKDPYAFEGVSLQETKGFKNKWDYIESYGCQMNFADSEVVASILKEEGFGITSNIQKASLILLNTCSIREKPNKQCAIGWCILMA